MALQYLNKALLLVHSAPSILAFLSLSLFIHTLRNRLEIPMFYQSW
jgi:hypothetical protein